ncbi:MAG: phage/plasmid primase, P4 family [Trichococcus flocculiformis]
MNDESFSTEMLDTVAEYEKVIDLNKKRNDDATNNGEHKLPTVMCAQYLLSKHHFIMVGRDSSAPLGVYLGDRIGIYTTDTVTIQRLIYQEDRRYTKRDVEDVMFKITMLVKSKPQENNSNLIPVANGIYNVKEHRLQPFTKDLVFTNKVATKWVENAPKPSWDVDEWLSVIANHNPDVVTLLWQIIAECLNGNYTRGKFFIFVGSGNNGKGTFQELLNNLIGKENVSSLRMEQIGDRFSPSTMAGKVANIGDDIKGDFLPDSQNILSITTGDTVTLEEKGKQAYSVNLKCALVFSANKIPKIKNTSNGLYRRMCIVPFLADFTGDVEDLSIKTEKILRSDVQEYILFKALSQDFERFIEPDVVKNMLNEYKKFNDPVVEFYQEIWTDDEYSSCQRIPTDYVYQSYVRYCDAANYGVKSLRSFVIEFEKMLGMQWEKKKARPGSDFMDNEWHVQKYSKPLQCFCKKDGVPLVP